MTLKHGRYPEKSRETRLRQFLKNLYTGLLTLAAAPFLFPGLPAAAEGVRDDRISHEADRLRVLATDKFIELLAIKPGMTVLDIGTGTGQFAYLFAELLAGTGKVYATDIDESCINLVKEEARRRRLDNLVPVLVKSEGVDEFYGRHRYDLITFLHVPLPNMAAFLAKMRDSLAEDGRLIVMRYRTVTPFSEEDFGDHFPELISELSREPAGSPFSNGLRETTRELLRKQSGAETDDGLRRAIVEDFNRMWADAQFGRDFLDGLVVKKHVDFTAAERMFAEAQLGSLRKAGLSDLKLKEANPKLINNVRRLNKLFFLQRFRKYLDPDRLFAPILDPKTIGSFKKAGFRLEKEDHTIRSFEDIGIFRPDKRTEER